MFIIPLLVILPLISRALGDHIDLCSTNGKITYIGNTGRGEGNCEQKEIGAPYSATLCARPSGCGIWGTSDIQLQDKPVLSENLKVELEGGVKYFRMDGFKIRKLAKGVFSRGSVLQVGLQNFETLDIEEDAFLGMNFSHFYLPNNSLSNINFVKNLPEETISLDLSDNQIQSVPEGLFSHLKLFLSRLELRKNKISNLETNFFHGMKSITFIDVSSNLLTEIAPGLFDNLTSLDVLDLSKNQISTLPKGIFSDLKYLTEIGLSDNGITFLEDDTFRRSTGLVKITLGNNKISSLPDNIFSGLTKLRNLELQGNKITSLSKDTFKGLEALQSLDLSNNGLTEIVPDILKDSNDLRVLKMSGNHISSIPEGLLSNLDYLFALYLDSNDITSFKANTFRGSSRLTTLSITNNRLSQITIDTFRRLGDLTYLYADANNFLQPRRMFGYFQDLEEIHLKENDGSCKVYRKRSGPSPVSCEIHYKTYYQWR